MSSVLVAGERRLRAVKLLGWTEIPVNIIDLEAVTRGEVAENAVRKDFTLSEAVAIKRALEPLEKITAKERQREGGRAGRKASGTVTICECSDGTGGSSAEFAKSTSGLKRPSKYRRKHIRPSGQFEICSQRNACQVIGMEIEHGRSRTHRPEGHLLNSLLLPPEYNHSVSRVLQIERS